MMLKVTRCPWMILILILPMLSACGDDDDEDEISDTIGGNVTAPNGQIARSFSQKPFYFAMLDFLIPEANAMVSGLTPVANALVELVRIDNTGAQIGGALAQARTDSTGLYMMETGVHGIPPSGDLILKVTGNNGVVMRAVYALGGADINPISDYIVDTVLGQDGVNLEVLDVQYLDNLHWDVAFDSNIDFSSAMTLADAKNLIANDSVTNTSITDGVTGLVGATSVGLPMDMSQMTATSTIEYFNCGFPLGGWSYSFSATQMTLVGTDTWGAGCSLGAEEEIVLTMSSLSANFDIPFNCADYPICTTSDFNKKLQGVDGDGRSYTSFYYYNGDTKTLTYIKYLPEETFREVITISQLP